MSNVRQAVKRATVGRERMRQDAVAIDDLEFAPIEVSPGQYAVAVQALIGGQPAGPPLLLFGGQGRAWPSMGGNLIASGIAVESALLEEERQQQAEEPATPVALCDGCGAKIYGDRIPVGRCAACEVPG